MIQVSIAELLLRAAGWQGIAQDRERAMREFRRMLFWIAAIGVLMAAGALWYLSLHGPLRLHMVVATVLGVFFSVLLGAGLFAAAFLSDKSGHDEAVGDATRRPDEED